MEHLYKIIYNLFIYPLILAGAKTGSLFHEKLKHGLRIHKNEIDRWQKKTAQLKPGKPRIWFHATSVGEFEQTRPVIELLKHYAGDRISIILSYYSPTVTKDINRYSIPDICEILPLDTLRSVNKVLDLVSPDILVFVKFDVWPNAVWQAAKRGVKLFLIDATLRKNSFRIFSFIGRSFSHSIYSKFSYIGTVSDQDTNRFAAITGKQNVVKTVGDTRFDRVKERHRKAASLQIPPSIYNNQEPVFICGSTWQGDEERLIPAVSSLHRDNFKFHTVIVPHEPSGARITFISDLLIRNKLKWKKYSEIQKGAEPEAVTIIDSVGFLAEFYQIGTFCLVGGGFLMSGVHNCMEPAVMGLPLCFGPNHHNAPEAEEMIKRGVAHEISTTEDIRKAIKRWLENSEKCSKEGALAKSYIKESIGASEVYCKDILKTMEIFCGIL